MNRLTIQSKKIYNLYSRYSGKIRCKSDIVIVNTLLYSNTIPTLHYSFSYVYQVFNKYRCSFKLSKSNFFKPRVERDLTVDGNFPPALKFSMIKEWIFHLMQTVPPTIQRIPLILLTTPLTIYRMPLIQLLALLTAVPLPAYHIPLIQFVGY